MRGARNRSRVGFDFDGLAERGEGVLASSWEHVDRERACKARATVSFLAWRWGRRHRRNRARVRFNELLVLSQLGLATPEEEAWVWRRFRLSQFSLFPFRRR